MQLAGGAPEANLRDGIADLEKALEKTSRQKNPAEWARIQNHLGVAIRRLDGGKSEKRFREAIEHFNAALEVRTPEEYPVECAQTLCNLANAFRDYPVADRKESLEKSLDAYDAAIDALHFGKDYQIEPQIETNKKHAEAVYRALPAEAKSQ
jgi:tetratricopeptide (TPR) repeat protein